MVFHCRKLCLYCVAIARRSVEHLFMVMYFEERTMSKRTITQKGTVNPKPDSVPVNALKCKFLTDGTGRHGRYIKKKVSLCR